MILRGSLRSRLRMTMVSSSDKVRDYDRLDVHASL